MKVLVQKSLKSSVSVDGEIVNKIDSGLVLLVGINVRDTSKDIDWMVNKVLNLRIFDDENGVMNKSILDVGGEILSISQFTLQAETKKGNRPSYINAMKGEDANKLYEEFGLNAQQISLIRQMRPKQDYYYSSQRGNRIFALALRASEAAFVTATNKTDQQAMDALLKKYPEISEGNRDIFIREWFRYKGMDEEWLLYLNKYQKRKGVKLRRRA